jgi:hypothetical protein
LYCAAQIVSPDGCSSDAFVLERTDVVIKNIV